MAGFAMYTARLMQRYANKAQQVVLAAAVFDKHGRVLVSPDGLLPSERITDSFLEKTPQDSFTVAHPLYHWMFQASRDWSIISSIIGGITNHLSHLPHTGRDNVSGDIKLITDHGELIENYDIIFRELFCAAAAGLAEKMKTSLNNVGILWDEIIATGGGGHAAHVQARRRQQDLERGIQSEVPTEGVPVNVASLEDLGEKRQVRPQISEFGRGSLLFLVRRVENTRDVEALAAAGYRFAELHQVSGIIGSSMQIKTRGFENKLRIMAGYAENNMLEPGVHMAFFGVRARVNNAYGFDILARRNARNLLPAVQMPLARLDPWQVNFLRQFERMTPWHIARRIENLKHSSPKEMMFASQLTDSIEALRTCIEDSIFDEAVLCSKTVEIPCRPVSPGSAPGTCTVITFRIVIPIHLHIESPNTEFVPLNLFKVHQLVYKDSPNHLIFARSVHREIAPIINAIPLVVDPTKPSPSVLAHSRRASIRDGRMTSRLFRFPRPHTSSTHGGAMVPEGHPNPAMLRRNSSSAGSEKTTSTIKLWNGRPSSEISRDADQLGHDAGLRSPPPAYSDELQPPRTPQSPSAPPTPPTAMAHQQQPSSFGGIMVSQEITVNVQTAGDVSDASPGSSFTGKGRVPSPRSATLLRRRTSEGHPGAIDDGKASSSTEARRPVAAPHYHPGGPSVPNGGSSTAGIELRSMAADRSSVHIGNGVQVSNVEADKLTEMPTFVDELFGFCVEGR